MYARVLVLLTTSLLIATTGIPAGADPIEDPTPPARDGTILPDQLVIGFEGPLPLDTEDWIGDLGGEIRITENTLSWVSVKFPDAETAEEALAAARARSDVRWAEHDGVVTHLILPGQEPNDPHYPNQWGFPAINAPEAWGVTQGSHDVVVAILDTGIQGDHPDLAANVCDLPHKSFVPGEPPLWDGYFHGTHVSGTVAAVNDNDLGVAGTSQSCLMDVKVLSRFGSGSWSGVAAGITYAADNGADVISMSLGGGSPPQIVEDAVNHAYHDMDVLVVAAAGNSGYWGCPSVGYPAAFPAAMAVASVDPPDGTEPSGFSSCGPEVEIAAPGADVLSTSNNNGYTTASGTSMATPHVSGVAALVMEQAPEASAPEIRCLLSFTSDDVGDPGWDEYTGWGRVNAETAVLTAPLFSGTLPAESCDLLLGTL